MIRLDVAQGSPEWIAARIGIPTASEFDKLITPKTGKPSASATPYLHRKVAEWLLGMALDDPHSPWIERGRVLEEEAAAWYALQTDADVQEVGFCLRDDRMAGASPDRLVGADGLLEVKCPALHTHVGYLLTDDVGDEYRVQAQGQLYITGRAWCDVLSYCPEMPPAVKRVERDEAFIAALGAAVDGFIARMIEARAEMVRRGFAPKGADV